MAKVSIYQKGTMGSGAHLISICQWEVKEGNVMQMEELSEMEKNTKSINNTKVEEEKFSRISMTSNSTRKGLRLISYYWIRVQ